MQGIVLGRYVCICQRKPSQPSVENCERVEQSSLPGMIIDIRSQYFEPHENLDNIAEACFLEFHAAVIKKERN